MITKYQLILIGSPNPFEQEFIDTFYLRTDELGVSEDMIELIRAADFDAAYATNAPAFCIYFGSLLGIYRDEDIIGRLQDDSKLILPVASDLIQFSTQIPESLRTINGFELNSDSRIEALVGVVLEGLSLLRLSRRLFISYKRDESSAVAIQLFEQLEKAGFDVFLDTHSIRPAEPFQDELWHRLADTDVVVLLNTPNFLVSNWTKEELAKANSMSIGILQLIWPAHAQERYAELSIFKQLTGDDFGNPAFAAPQSYLSQRTVDDIVRMAESLRARSLAARQTNMINEFIAAAEKTGAKCSLQPGKYLLVDKGDGTRLIVIPAVGVPQALTYHQSEDLVKTIRTNDIPNLYLLYDHLNIRDKWVRHLDWLDQYLAIKSIKLLEVETKLPTLV